MLYEINYKSEVLYDFLEWNRLQFFIIYIYKFCVSIKPLYFFKKNVQVSVSLKLRNTENVIQFCVIFIDFSRKLNTCSINCLWHYILTLTEFVIMLDVIFRENQIR